MGVAHKSILNSQPFSFIPLGHLYKAGWVFKKARYWAGSTINHTGAQDLWTTIQNLNFPVNEQSSGVVQDLCKQAVQYISTQCVNSKQGFVNGIMKDNDAFRNGTVYISDRKTGIEVLEMNFIEQMHPKKHHKGKKGEEEPGLEAFE